MASNNENDEKLYDQLKKAIDEGNLEETKRLINDEGVYINKLDEDLKTPLVRSIEKGKYEISRWLLDNGAYVDLPVMPMEDYKMHSALYSAILNGETEENYEFTEELIKRGANLNVDQNEYDNDNYKLPLRLAIEKGYNKIAKLLIENGAKYDSIDKTKCDEKVKEVIDKKEQEKKEYRQSIIDELREDIHNDDTLKSKISGVDNFDKVIELYVDRKMRVNVNLGELSSNELDDLLVLNNYRKEKNREKRVERNENTQNEITKEEIQGYLDKDTPVCIRAVSSAVGIEGLEDTAIGKNRNKTGIEMEIDKLVREENEETNTLIKGKKVGNPSRSVTMINYGKVLPFRNVGYGFVGDNLNDIYVAASRDINTKYSKKRNGLVMNTGEVLDINISVEEQIKELLRDLKNQERVNSHNELVMDVSSKNVKFIFWAESKRESENLGKLKAVYFRKKYYEETGRKLPIFQYKPGDKDYLKESNFTKEEVNTMLKDEMIEKLDGVYQLKSPYNTERALKLLTTLKEEIDSITLEDDIPGQKKTIQTLLEKFVEDKVEFYSKKENVKNIHDVVNLIKFTGMVKGKEYQDEVFCNIFKDLDLNKVIIDFLRTSNTGYGDIIKGFAKLRDNRTVDFAIEIISDIRSLVVTDKASKLLKEKLENINEYILVGNVINKIRRFYIMNDREAKEILDICSKNSELKEGLFKGLMGSLNSKENLEKLINQGMDINEVDKNGKSILVYAKESGKEEILDYLKENGVSISDIDEIEPIRKRWSYSIESIDSIDSDTISINDEVINQGVDLKDKIAKFEEIAEKSKVINTEDTMKSGIARLKGMDQKSKKVNDLVLNNNKFIETGNIVKDKIAKFEKIARESKERNDIDYIGKKNNKINDKLTKNKLI